MRVKQWEEIDSPGRPLDFQRLPGIPIMDAAMMPGRRLRLKFYSRSESLILAKR